MLHEPIHEATPLLDDVAVEAHLRVLNPRDQRT
jgi:hypothetical protein